jgi:hypothetical protein
MRIIPLLLTALLSTVLLAAGFFPRHVDPSQVLEEKPPVEFLLLYSQIGDYVLQLDFQKAFKILNNASYAYVPRGLAYIFERFNRLLNETMMNMNSTRHELALCRGFLEDSKIPLAEEWLGRALRSLAASRMSYYMLEDSSREVSRHVEPQPISRAVSGIAGGILRLEDEAWEINATLHGLKPIGVRLEISVNPRNVVFGQGFNVSGFLRGEDGLALGGRVVILHVGGGSYSLETGYDGSYSTVCYALEYSRLAVFAEYVPRGGDVGKYSYAASDTVFVNVTYYTPRLNLSLSRDRVLPGEMLTVNIFTVPGISLILNTPWGTFSGVSDDSGFLSYSLRIPLNAGEGSYTVSASTLPKGLYSPVRGERRLMVYRLEANYSLSMPGVVFTGVPFMFGVYVDTESTITIHLEELNTTYTCHGFNLSNICILPLTFLPGSLKASIRIVPDSPVYRGMYAESRVTVLNTAALAVPAATVVMLSAGRFRRRVEAPIVGEASGGVEEALKPRHGVYRLFHEFVGFLEGLYGVFMKPSDTIREYFSRVRVKIHSQLIGFVGEAFECYERLIYGRPREGFEEYVSKLLGRVIEVFRGVFKK